MRITVRSSYPASLLITASILLTACSGTRPMDIGLNDGQLTPCPSSPNCVNSRANNAEHAIAPITFKQGLSPTDAMKAIKQAILSLPRTEIINETSTYLYAESSTKIMRFVDDVEFQFADDELIQEVHVRSASRLGYKDFGVNRARIESVRAKLVEMGLARRDL